ncbi:MAG: isochorismate synthase [Gemmatimonadota bacterium]
MSELDPSLLVTAPPGEEPEAVTPILVSESLRVVRASPWALLSRFSGRPRGFWGRGGGWVAHGGLAWDWTCAEPSRVGRLRTALRALGADDPVGDQDLRLFGGFSFSRHGASDPRWSAFPSARFQVPQVELRTDGEAYRLIARARLTAGQDERPVRAGLRDELAALEAALADEPAASPCASAPVAWSAAPETQASFAAWTRNVRMALEAIQGGRFRKVVLARSVSVDPYRGVDALTATRRLYAPGSEARVFLFEPEPGRALLGASPETLARVHDGEAHATAVAGSIARGADDTADREARARLSASDKDLREHGFVVRDMIERLQALGADVSADGEPHILTLPNIHHLETRIRARLPERVSVLDLIERLHPTPAVCGQPRDAALEFIENQEGFDRGWYGAPVGWLDLRGNGVTAPALRCALLERGRCHLFAGAGIVEGSDPTREWEETQLKLETAGRALAGSA